LFDTSIKTPKTPLHRRLSYLIAACLVIALTFWIIATLANMLLSAVTPEPQTTSIDGTSSPIEEPIEVMIEIDEPQDLSEDNN